MGLRWIFLFLSTLLPAGAAHAEEWKLTEHGDLNLVSTGYFDSIPPTNSFLETVRASAELTAKYGKPLRIKFVPLLQADPFNHSASERYWAEVPAAYAQYQVNNFTFQLGFNTYTWGVTDGYNPLDSVSARRLQDPINSDKLGVFSTSIQKDLGWINLEGIYIPKQRTSILPGNNSRWLPREVFTTTSIGSNDQAATLNLPSNLQYSIGDGSERNQALENNFGARAQFISVVQGLDLSIQGFNGAATTPSIDVIASGTVTQLLPAIVIQADPGITLIPVYARQWVFGGSFVYTNFGMIFKGEAAITRLISKGQDLLGNAEEYVFEIERPFPIAGQDLTVILSGTYARHTEPINNSTLSLSRIFDRAVITGLRYRFTEKLSILGSALYDTESHGDVFHVEASYAATDTVKLNLAADSLDGNSNTPIGTYRDNDRIMGSVKLAF